MQSGTLPPLFLWNEHTHTQSQWLDLASTQTLQHHPWRLCFSTLPWDSAGVGRSFSTPAPHTHPHPPTNNSPSSQPQTTPPNQPQLSSQPCQPGQRSKSLEFLSGPVVLRRAWAQSIGPKAQAGQRALAEDGLTFSLLSFCPSDGPSLRIPWPALV